jgi:cation:H+ antiporter
LNHAVEKFRAEDSPLRFLWPSAALVVGLVLVVVSADLAVEHALGLATRHGLNPTAIGLFGIGVGTSLPELAVSIGAAARGRPALSLGNVLGSNTFDLLVPMGVGALIHPLTVEPNSLYFDLPAIAILALYFAFRLSTRGRLDTRDAVGLFGFYLAFVLSRLGTFVG